MKVAFIPPVSLLEYTELTSYQLVLPHMMKTNPTYNNHYTRLAKSGKHYMILDNGEAEGENNFTADQLLGMATHLGFNEVVAHDVMGNMIATVKSTEEFLQAVAERYKRREHLAPRIGIVAQGKTTQEIHAFVERFLDPMQLDWTWDVLYLPRHLIETLGSIRARTELAQSLDKKFHLVKRGIGVHFLGAHHDAPMEMVQAVQTVPWVRGMDTSMPFNYALAGARMGEGHHRRVVGYFNLRRDEFHQPELIRMNTDQLLRWANVPAVIATAGPSED